MPKPRKTMYAPFFLLRRAKLILTEDVDDDEGYLSYCYNSFLFTITILGLYFLKTEFARSLTLKFELQCSIILRSQ